MIVSSAIKHREDGRIWKGRRHSDCFLSIVDEAPEQLTKEEKMDWAGKIYEVCIQGFLTDTGAFLNREEAYFYASEKGQIEFDKGPTLLISEMLWLED